MIACRSALSRSLCLGLALGVCGPASAAPRSKPAVRAAKASSASGLDAQRAVLRSVVELGAFVAQPSKDYPDLQLLVDHHHHLGHGDLHLAKNGQAELRLQRGSFSDLDLMVVPNVAGAPRKAAIPDLAAFGISDRESIGALIARRVQEAAGTKSAGKGSANAADVLRAQLKEGEAVVAAFHANEDLKLVLSQFDTVLAPKKIVTDFKDILPGFWRTGGNLYALDDGAGHQPRARHLALLGLGSAAAVDKHFADLVVKVAVMGGAARPKSVAAARTALREQIADAQALGKLVADPQSHADLALLCAAHRAMKPAAPPSLTLAQSQGVTLVIQTGYGDTIALVEKPGATPKKATLADLQRVGLGTMAQLDAALAPLLYSIAAEDFR